MGITADTGHSGSVINQPYDLTSGTASGGSSSSPRAGKFPIQNSRGQSMYVRTDIHEAQTGLVFVLHGFSGGMDQPHVQAVGDAFHRNGYTVVYLDATHSFNDSDGTLEGNTTGSHRQDLDDCINWAKTQDWYQEPYALGGHSLGSFVCLFHAADNPDKVELVVPTATALSGDHLEEAFKNGSRPHYDSFKSRGFHHVYDNWSGKNQKAKRSWAWLEDMRRYDVTKHLDKLTMPACFIVGSRDMPTPPSQQTMLFNAWKGQPKALYIVEGAEHTFTKPDHLQKLRDHLDGWLKQVHFTRRPNTKNTRNNAPKP